MADNICKKILIVEDSVTQARMQKIILEQAGFEVEIAADGVSGFDCFCKGNYDLVLSDVMMPGISGYELCRKLKAHPKGKHVPVVLLTALNELSNLIEGLRVGADNFITKPFEPSYLVARVNSESFRR
jgi:DNA-binding response OmpR family regulator